MAIETPPVLQFIGVLHQDPLGPERVRDCMTAIEDQHGTTPAFVAVEWAECSHRRAVALRNRLQFELVASLHKFDPDFITALVRALAYEGDVHHDVWPGARTLWLDDRVLTHNIIYKPDAFLSMDRDRALMYTFGIINAGITSDVATGDALDRLSRQLWDEVADLGVNETREASWFQALTGAVAALESGGYGVVVVGDGHLSEDEQFIFRRCREEGISCCKRSTNPDA